MMSETEVRKKLKTLKQEMEELNRMAQDSAAGKVVTRCPVCFLNDGRHKLDCPNHPDTLLAPGDQPSWRTGASRVVDGKIAIDEDKLNTVSSALSVDMTKLQKSEEPKLEQKPRVVMQTDSKVSFNVHITNMVKSLLEDKEIRSFSTAVAKLKNGPMHLKEMRRKADKCEYELIEQVEADFSSIYSGFATYYGLNEGHADLEIPKRIKELGLEKMKEKQAELEALIRGDYMDVNEPQAAGTRSLILNGGGQSISRLRA